MAGRQSLNSKVCIFRAVGFCLRMTDLTLHKWITESYKQLISLQCDSSSFVIVILQRCTRLALLLCFLSLVRTGWEEITCLMSNCNIMFFKNRSRKLSIITDIDLNETFCDIFFSDFTPPSSNPNEMLFLTLSKKWV